jgi:CHAT domain-containing protein
MQLMQPDQLDSAHPATETPVEGLESAKPAWQRRVAAQLMSASGATESAARTASPHKLTLLERFRLQSAWITVPAAAVIVFAVIFTGIALWRYENPSDARLLALAYNKQRTLALRIPGGDPVQLASITRGATNGISDNTELLKLRVRVQQHLDQTPNSAYWHQVLGETNLLEQNGDAALHNFETAQATDDSLPNLQPDLAAAWFELGDYAKAANFYLIEINHLNDGHPHPTGPALLYYNVALCWERQNSTDNALVDLRLALAAERDPAWRAAIQHEIDRLSNRSSLPQSTDPLESDGYEAALANAIANDLPHWPESRAKLLATAALGLRHHDRWLSDWIAAPHTAPSQQADEHLSRSVRAANGGGAETSLTEARQALALYARVGNSPGRLRAEYAETYAFQRLGRDEECVAGALSTEREGRIEQYSVLRGGTLLNHSICQSRVGNFSAAQHINDQVLTVAADSDLPQLRLHAMSMDSALLSATGRPSAAWQLDTTALRICAQEMCPPGLRYSFLYDMVSNAQTLGLNLTATNLMRTAVSSAAASTDAVTHAYALETLASVAGRSGDFSTSADAFAEASRIAHSGNQAALAQIYQSEWKTDEAEVLSRQGRPQAALALLQQSAPVLLASDYVPGRISYYHQASVAQFGLHHYDDAVTDALAAVHESEQSLPNLHTSAAKEHWMRENLPIYAQLVKAYLGRGDATLALQAWERFRSTAYAPSANHTAGTRLTAQTYPNTRILVIARVDDTYVGWLARPQPLQAERTVTLGDRDHLQQLATTFYRLCADRDSSVDDVQAVGARLYQVLLSPLLERDPPSPQTLWIDLDPSLAMVPIAALSSSSGKWLGDSTQVAVLPAWWSLDPGAAFQQPGIGRESRMVLVNGFDRGYAGQSEITELRTLLPHTTVIDGASATRDSVLQGLATADVFHFSGHATADAGVVFASAPGAPQSLSPDALDGVHLPHCRLAVLAACNTTAADPDQVEELPDLRNALLSSGAQTVIASNWDVDDRSTRSLMLAFYKQLASGLSPTQSLQSAQQTVRSTGGWQHPYYWAAFEVFTN